MANQIVSVAYIAMSLTNTINDAIKENNLDDEQINSLYDCISDYFFYAGEQWESKNDNKKRV